MCSTLAHVCLGPLADISAIASLRSQNGSVRFHVAISGVTSARRGPQARSTVSQVPDVRFHLGISRVLRGVEALGGFPSTVFRV